MITRNMYDAIREAYGTVAACHAFASQFAVYLRGEDFRLSVLHGYVPDYHQIAEIEYWEDVAYQTRPLTDIVRSEASEFVERAFGDTDAQVDDLVEAWHPALCQRYRDIVTPWHAAGCPGPMPAGVRETCERMRAVEREAREAVAARERAALREFERVCAAAVRSGVRRSREMAVSDMERAA